MSRRRHPTQPSKPASSPRPVSHFVEHYFRHFNAAILLEAAREYRRQLEIGNHMMLTLAGAMRTAELGRSLAGLIRRDRVHLISCTGANLEEVVFNLVAHDFYERVPHYRALSAADEAALLNRYFHRVAHMSTGTRPRPSAQADPRVGLFDRHAHRWGDNARGNANALHRFACSRDRLGLHPGLARAARVADASESCRTANSVTGGSAGLLPPGNRPGLNRVCACIVPGAAILASGPRRQGALRGVGV